MVSRIYSLTKNMRLENLSKVKYDLHAFPLDCYCAGESRETTGGGGCSGTEELEAHGSSLQGADRRTGDNQVSVLAEPNIHKH